MADTRFMLVVDAAWKGAGAIRQASADVKKLGSDAETAGKGSERALKGLALGVGGVTAAFGVAAVAGKALYSTLKEGAALTAAQGRFENLTKTIGTTADALMNDLRAATNGLQSDAQLVAGATDIISLGLAKTHDETVRLTNVVGRLGLDMNQVILTFANNSKMRLDALGLSIDDVEERTRAFEEAGKDANEAFDLAVLEALESKVDLLGDASQTTAGKIQQMEVAAQNIQDSFKVAFVNAFADSFGNLADQAGESAKAMNEASIAAGKITGELTAEFAQDLSNIIIYFDQLNRDPRSMYGFLADFLKEDPGGFFTGDFFGGVSERILAQRKAMEREIYGFQGIFEAGGEGIAESAQIIVNEVDTALLGMAQSRMWERAGDAIAENMERIAKRPEALGALKEDLQDQLEAWYEMYQDFGVRAAEGFNNAIEGLGDVEIPDLVTPDGFNMDLVADAIYAAGTAAGATAPQLAGLGVALGEFDSATAEAAIKAAIFQDTLSGLIGQWKVGKLDTSELLGAVDEAVGIIENTSLPELELRFGPPKFETPSEDFQLPWGDDFTQFWPEEARTVNIRGNADEVDVAIAEAMQRLQGIPPEERTTQILADLARVEQAATSDIPGLIQGIPESDRTIKFLEDGSAVIAFRDEISSPVHVPVHFYTASGPTAPSPPPPIPAPIGGRQHGGAVGWGQTYLVGEAGPELFIPHTSGQIVPNERIGANYTINLPMNFYGPTSPERVQTAVERAAETVLREVEKAGKVA
jgi:hypothetical protein